MQTASSATTFEQHDLNMSHVESLLLSRNLKGLLDLVQQLELQYPTTEMQTILLLLALIDHDLVLAQFAVKRSFRDPVNNLNLYRNLTNLMHNLQNDTSELGFVDRAYAHNEITGNLIDWLNESIFDRRVRLIIKSYSIIHVSILMRMLGIKNNERLMEIVRLRQWSLVDGEFVKVCEHHKLNESSGRPGLKHVALLAHQL